MTYDLEIHPRTLIVYTCDSHYKYYNLFSEHLYEVTSNSNLIVYQRDTATGDEKTVSHFRNWDYFIIE